MTLEELLNMRLGFGLDKASKKLNIKPQKLQSISDNQPKLFEVLIKGLEVGSKWVDFDKNLKEHGYIIISSSGKVKYEKVKSTGLKRLLWDYGIPKISDLCDLIGMPNDYQSVRRWYKTKPELFQYLAFGASYMIKFRHVETAYNKNIAVVEKWRFNR